MTHTFSMNFSPNDWHSAPSQFHLWMLFSNIFYLLAATQSSTAWSLRQIHSACTSFSLDLRRLLAWQACGRILSVQEYKASQGRRLAHWKQETKRLKHRLWRYVFSILFHRQVAHWMLSARCVKKNCLDLRCNTTIGQALNQTRRESRACLREPPNLVTLGHIADFGPPALKFIVG